jgi:sarcosine oxidase, subunit gamma
MADLTTLRRSPLAHLTERLAVASAPGVVTLTEQPYAGQVSLRVDPRSAAGARVVAVLGAPFPTMGAVADDGTLWLGPDEFLVLTSHDAVALADQLSAAIGADPGLALDVSANRTVLALEGPWARAVLAKGCPADLHPRAFATGTAISTTLARVPLILWRTDDERFLLLPRASFADYVARWLMDAMTEYTG